MPTSRFLVLLMVFLFFIPSFGSYFSKEDCLDADFQSRFGPVQSQGDSNYCWAFAGAQLAEEQACKQNPSLCGKSLSRLDISSCDYKLHLDKKNQFGHVQRALSCAFEKGVCEEQFAPFPISVSFSNCNRNKVFLNTDRNIEILSLKFRFTAKANSLKKNEILKSFVEDRSWSASICLEKWEDSPMAQEIKRPLFCNRHVVVIDAMRWNEEHQRCEWHVRNSAASANLKDWVPADKLLPTIFAITRIRDKTKSTVAKAVGHSSPTF